MNRGVRKPRCMAENKAGENADDDAGRFFARRRLENQKLGFKERGGAGEQAATRRAGPDAPRREP